jgi:fucose 4-O-acetylase-like acetyltransferase
MMPTSTPRSASASAEGTTERTSHPAPRDPWFDNAKFALVTLVVVGHSMTMLPKNVTDNWIYDFLYAWHVPAFVLVTGYLSRSFDYTPKRMWSLVRTVVVPYLVFEGALAVFRTQVGGETLRNIWQDPHWPMWYLSALFFWRLATPVFKRMPMHLAVPVAVAVSVVAGAFAGNMFDFARIVGLLPFFVVGLTLRREHVAALHRTWVRFAGLGVLAAIFVAARFTDRVISTEWLYYRARYSDLGTPNTTAMLTRLVLLGIGLLGALAFLSLIPATRTWFTRLGGASLVVYLFHGFVVKGAEYAGLPDWASAHPLASLLLVPAVAVLLATVLSLPSVAGRLNHLVDPLAWLYGALRPTMPPVVPDDVPVPHQHRQLAPMSAIGR